MRRLAFCIFMLFCFDAHLFAANEPAKILQLTDQLNSYFQELDRELSRAAQNLSASGAQTGAGRQILIQLCSAVRHSIDCAFVNLDGKMSVVEPASFSDYEGTDIGEQEHVKKILETKRPVMSGLFTSVEGKPSLDLEYPLFSPEKIFLGSVSLLIDPFPVFGDILEESLKQGGDELLILQEDGTIIYSTRRSFIGKNVFSDDSFQTYREFSGLMSMVFERSDGQGSAVFPNPAGEPLQRLFTWGGFEFYDQVWRIVLVSRR